MALEAEMGDVQKFEMDESDYAKRTDSVLAWKQKMGFGRFDADRQKRKVFMTDNMSFVEG